MVMQPGDIIFVKRKTNTNVMERLIQRVIRWATGSDYFHVAYFISGNLAFEANSFRTAGVTTLDDYAEYDVKRLVFEPETRLRILNRIIATSGASYGWGEIMALGLRRVGINVYYDDTSRYICSEELIKAVYAETGVHIVDQTTGDVSPGDLAKSPYLTEV